MKHVRQDKSFKFRFLPVLVGFVFLFSCLIALGMTKRVAFATEDENVILSLEPTIITLRVAVGTDKSDIPLPASLRGTLANDVVTDIPVTWDDSGLYDKDVEGVYIFIANFGSYKYSRPQPIAKVIVSNAVTGSQTGLSSSDSNGSISGTVWLDSNSDGLINNGETGIGNCLVYLYREAIPVAHTETDENGNYAFTGLEGGNYRVVVFAGAQYNTPSKTIRAGSDNRFDADATLAPFAASSSVSLADDEAVENVHAGMLPKEIMPVAVDTEIYVSNADELKDAIDAANKALRKILCKQLFGSDKNIGK